MNNVIIVGRLATDPILEETSTGKKRTCITLAVPRPYKNTDGLYETDFIRVVLWNAVASSTKEYCHQGDMVGIKGRIQNREYEIEDEKEKENLIKKHITEVVAEKVTFISSKKVTPTDEESSEVNNNIVNCY